MQRTRTSWAIRGVLPVMPIHAEWVWIQFWKLFSKNWLILAFHCWKWTTSGPFRVHSTRWLVVPQCANANWPMTTALIDAYLIDSYMSSLGHFDSKAWGWGFSIHSTESNSQNQPNKRLVITAHSAKSQPAAFLGHMCLFLSVCCAQFRLSSDFYSCKSENIQ